MAAAAAAGVVGLVHEAEVDAVVKLNHFSKMAKKRPD